MLKYYTVIIFVSIASMVIIQISISKSWTLTKNKKLLFHMLFSAIAIAAFCEWFAYYLQETGSSLRTLHIAMKAIELSIAPALSFLIAWLIEVRRPKLVFALLAFHALLECSSAFLGFIYVVDENNVYRHGSFYWIYMCSYLFSILYATYIIVRNINKYQYSGLLYFLCIVGFMLSGIVIQTIDSELKVDYVVLAVNAIMLYVFTLEMIQQTDPLTELINRRGYDNYISHMDEACVILFFDIDQFKNANDQYGHAFGDFCIASTGKTIKKIYAKYGKCFRYGGDEFCVVLTKKQEEVQNLNRDFENAMEQIRQQEKRLPFISMGYAYYNPESNDIRKAIEEADQMMYEYKEKAHKTEAGLG